MRILQLIDSLNPGGAEKMAVNFANALANSIDFSALVATRAEGELKKQLDSKVSFFFLNKKRSLDFFAFLRLLTFINKNKIEIIHAHSSSFFLATLLKIVCPKIKLIWHDHYGNSEFLEKRNLRVLKQCSRFFYITISVNDKLKNWALKNLLCKNVYYLPNFIIDDEIQTHHSETKLFGQDNKRILCLANLRPQKNHEMLLKLASRLKTIYPDWTFHLVGKDFNDSYSDNIKLKIKENSLENNVFIYGTRTDIKSIIGQSTIGILTSKSEGLPLAILEYGLYGLPVVSTNVGEIPNVISSDSLGILVDSDDISKFCDSIAMIIEHPDLGEKIKKEYSFFIKNNFTAQAVLNNYIKMIRNNV